MPLISETVIDDIHARADIVELIGRYVPLTRAGRHFKAHCPFHKERTPSFMVNTDKQIFHCFGCGVGGNIFSFLMQHDRLTFPEAVRQLADHVGVRVPEREANASDGAHERLRTVMEKSCRYFERMLHDPKTGKAARAYLERRGVSEQTRGQFRLGLAPPGWDTLLTAAKATGVSADQLEAAGMLVKGTSGHCYDRFRNRLMFPIMNVRGQIVGFGGRSLDTQEPKYLNSPETTLYSKGRHLFGLSLAKDAIIAAKTAIVVEGYFDCVVLAGAGISHVVSPLGTALTEEHARLLKRYAEHVILAFDADAAGEQATLRGIDLLVEAGLQVRVAQFPQGVDPDEVLRAHGRERLEQLVEQSLNLFDALVHSALRRYPATDAESTVQAAQFVLPTIARIPDAMLRSEYVRLLAARLRLDEAAVAHELANIKSRLPAVTSGSPAGRPSRAMKQGSVRSVAHGPERLLVALVLDDPARWEQARAIYSIEDMADPILRRIVEVVGELAARGHPTSPAHVVSRLLESGHGDIVAELVELAQSLASKDAAFEDCLKRLRATARKRVQARLREEIRLAHAAGREDDVKRLLSELQRVHQGG
jgi:DNA primase